MDGFQVLICEPRTSRHIPVIITAKELTREDMDRPMGRLTVSRKKVRFMDDDLLA